jgi:hypothetical protein
MKKIYFIVLFLCLGIMTQAQSHVFILVDVSKSVKQSQLDDAREAIYEILTGTQPSKAFITQGKQSDLAQFKLKQGDKLSISTFGDLDRSSKINPVPSTDMDKTLNSISWIPTDGQTYLTLAKAKIAEYTKNNSIAKYKLYIISDNINDDYGPNGSPNYPKNDNNYTQDLVEGYNTSTNPVAESGYTKLKFNKNSSFSLSLSPGVDVTHYTPPTNPNAVIPLPVDTSSVIKINSPTGTRKKAYQLKGDKITLSWACTNSPQGIRYNVTFSGMDGTKGQPALKNVSGNSASAKLPDGKYRITVSASNYQASSDTTYADVSTGGGFGWIIFLLILAAAAGIGYYFWNKNRQEKFESDTDRSTENIFSTDSDNDYNNSNNTNNNSDSDYF